MAPKSVSRRTFLKSALADPRIIEALDLLRGVMADILARRRRLAEALTV